MIRFYNKLDGQLKEVESLEASCWVNIVPPFESDRLEALANKLDFPIDFIRDPLDQDERSRYEKEEDARLIIVNTPVLNEVDQDNQAIYITIPIGIILTEDYVITLSSSENTVIGRFLEDSVRHFDPRDEQLFVLKIFELNVVRFLDDLKKLNLKRNLIEMELYDSSRNSELKQLLRIEKSLVYFVNSLSSNELLKMKMKRTDFLKIREDEDKTDLFEDIIIDNSQALEMSNVHSNILGGTMEAYASIVSNNLNIFIKRLTVVTIILMVPTLVASFYGMNLPWLPGDQSEYAFFYIVLISIVISLFLVWFFRRNRLF